MNNESVKNDEAGLVVAREYYVDCFYVCCVT